MNDLKNHNLKMEIKLVLYKAMVLLTLMYDSEPGLYTSERYISQLFPFDICAAHSSYPAVGHDSEYRDALTRKHRFI